MKTAIHHALFVAAALLIAGGCYAYWLMARVASSEGIHSKREWSVLQSVQAHGTNASSKRIVVVTRDTYYCAGVQTAGKKGRVWILLNPEFEPYVKVLGDQASVSMAPAEIEALKEGYPVHRDVLSFLKTRREERERAWYAYVRPPPDLSSRCGGTSSSHQYTPISSSCSSSKPKWCAIS